MHAFGHPPSPQGCVHTKSISLAPITILVGEHTCFPDVDKLVVENSTMGELRLEEEEDGGVLELEEGGGAEATISSDGQFADYDGDDVKFKEEDECTGKMSLLLTLSLLLTTQSPKWIPYIHTLA